MTLTRLSSSSTGGNLRSGLLNRAAVSPRHSPLEGADLAASGKPDVAAGDVGDALFHRRLLHRVSEAQCTPVPAPAGPYLFTCRLFRHMGAMYVGLGSCNRPWRPGGVLRRWWCCLVEKLKFSTSCICIPFWMPHFQVSKKCETNHGHKLCYLLCNCKVLFKNMIICGLYEKDKMIGQKHRLCYILCNCKVSSKNMIICGLYEKEKWYVKNTWYYSLVSPLFRTCHVWS
jgi:hypothetical protein